MGKLGTLFYEVLLTDGTDKGIKSIESKLKQLKSKISVDTSGIAKDIESALSKKTFTAKVGLNVDTSALKNLTATANVKLNVDQTALNNVGNQLSKSKSAINVDTSGIQNAVDESKKASKKIKSNFDEGLSLKRTYTSSRTDISSIIDSWKPIDVSKEYAKLQKRVNAMKAYVESRVEQNGGRIVKGSQLDSLVRDYEGKVKRLEILSRRRDSALSALERIGGMRTTMTVTDLPKKGSELWRHQEEERAARIASMKRAWNEYFKKDPIVQWEEQKKRRQANSSAADYSKGWSRSNENYLNTVRRAEEALRTKFTEYRSRYLSGNGGSIESANRNLLNYLSARNERLTLENQKQATETQRQAQKQAIETQRQADATRAKLQQIPQELGRVGEKANMLQGILGSVFSVYGIKEFLGNLISIGGEFEKQKIALGALLGSANRASVVYSQLKSLAVESPFQFGQLAAYTKQMASFGIQYKDLFDTTKRLADVSAGVGVDLSRIILAYGQVYTAQFLKGTELKQFTEAGIPMVDALAKRFTKLKGEIVSSAKVYEMISKKEISFDDVKAVMEEMTNEGGRFYNMQEKLSESLSGRWSNLKDQIEIMYSEVASSSGGLLKGTVTLLIKIARHWKDISTFVYGALITYGLLAGKSRILASLTSSSSMLTNASLANAKALQAEEAEYRRVITLANEAGVSRQRGGYGIAVAENKGFRKAILTERARTALVGGRYAKYDDDLKRYGIKRDVNGKLTSVVSRSGSARLSLTNALERGLVSVNRQIDKCGGKMGWMRKTFIKAQLAGISFGNSFKNALSNVFNMTNGIFLVIGLLVGWIMKRKQDAETFNNQMNDSIEGSKQGYKELKDFIENNPIEVAIETKDSKSIDSLIRAYSEKLENAPIDLSWVKNMADGIDNNIKKLEYLKQKTEELENINIKGENGHNTEFAKKAFDASDMSIWGYDDLTDTLEDIGDAYKLLRTIQELLFHDTEGILTIGKGYKTFNKAQKETYDLWKKGKIDNFTFDMQFSKLNEHDAYKRYYRQLQEFGREVDKTSEKLKDMYAQNPSYGVNFDKLTDKGFMELQKTIDEMATLNNWSERYKQTFMDFFTQKLTPAEGATWQYQAGLYKDFLNELDKYTDDFKGKDRSDIMNGIQKGMKNGMRDALEAAKLALITKFPQFKAQIQSILDSEQFHYVIAAHFSVDTKKDLGPLSQVFDNQFGSGKWVKNGAEYLNSLRPKEGESFTDYAGRLKSEVKSNEEEYKNRQAFDKKHGTHTADTNKLDTSKAVLTGMGFPNEENEKKGNKGTNSADSAREKDRQAREKANQKYEKGIQKELKQIKRVRDLFYKLRDLYGDVEALERVRKSGLVRADLVPKSATTKREFDVAYGKQLAEFKKKIEERTDTLKDLKNDEIPSDIFENQLGIDKDDLEKETKIIERALNKFIDAWSRYKSLKDSGVSSKDAGNMSFGYEYVADEDVSEEIKRRISAKLYQTQGGEEAISKFGLNDILDADEDKLNEMFGNNKQITSWLWKMVDEYQKAAKALTSENDKMYSELLESSLSYEGKKEKENRKYNKKVRWIDERVEARPAAEEKVKKAQESYDDSSTILEIETARLEETPEYKEYKRLLTERNALPKEDVGGRAKYDKSLNEAEKKYKKTTQYKRYSDAKDANDKDYKNLDDSKKWLYNNTLTEKEGGKLKAGAEIEHNKEIDKIDDEQFKNSLDYMDFFNAIYNLTIEKANKIGQSIKENLSDRLQQGTISAKDYYEEIQQIDSQMQKLQNRKMDSSLWFKGLKGHQDFRVEMANQRIAHAANSVDYYRKQEENAAKNGDEEKRVSSNNSVEQWSKELNDAQEAGDKEKEKQARYGKQEAIMNNIGSATESLGKFRDSVGGLMSSFGNDSENNAGFQTFSTVVDAVSEVGSGIQDGFQKIMSGDFIGAALSMISTPLNVIKMFNELHDKKLEIMIKESQKRGKEIKAAADEIKVAIDDSLGTDDAKDRALSRYSQLSKQMSNAGFSSKNNYYQYVYDALNGKQSVLKDTTAIGSSYDSSKYKKALKATGASYLGGLGASTLFGVPLAGGIGMAAFGTTLAIGGIINAIKKRKAANKELKQYYSDSDLDALPKKYKRKMKNKKQLIEAAKAREEEEQEALKGHGFTSEGNISAYGAEYLALLEQRKEIEKQMMLENNKKDKDDDKLADYRNQITELNEQIRTYAKNLAKELYGIDISSWANKLGEALVNAFENGENAAEAFHKTAVDIIKDVVKNMFIQDLIKPELVSLETALFGKDGEGGGILSDINNPQEAINKALPIINDSLSNMEEKIPVWEAVYDGLNSKLGGNLTSYSDGSSSMTMSAKGLTEETGDLLASYVNAIRADVSINRGYMQTLVEISIPKMSVIAESQLKQLGQILEQTKLIESNTRSNADTAQEIKSALSSVIVFNGGGKAIRIKS